MKEYYVDITMTNEIEEWLLLQGASVRAADSRIDDFRPAHGMHVRFGHRDIHYYAGSKQARIFFNDENVSTATIMLFKWPNEIFCHSLPMINPE